MKVRKVSSSHRSRVSLSALYTSPDSPIKRNSNGIYTVERLDYSKLTDSKSAENALSLLLTRTVEGSNKTLYSPIVNNMCAQGILDGWDLIYRQSSGQINDILDRIEEANRSKYGTRSLAVPWAERRENFYSAFGRGGDIPYLQSLGLGHTSRLRPLAKEVAAKYIKPNTNSGPPSFTKKREVLPQVLLNFESELRKMYPCSLFTRTQELGKTRDVWGYPVVYILDEMRYYQPILALQRKAPWRAALRSPSELDHAVNLLLKNSKKRGYYVVSSDIKGFDKDAKRELQLVAFNSFAQSYQNQYRDGLMEQFNRFNTIGIITPDGVVSGPHGIPSGSSFTNEVGSEIQRSIIYNTPHCSLDDCQTQGDDALVSAQDPDDLFNSFEECNLTVGYEKVDISDEYAVYLQLLFHPQYCDETTGEMGGVYSTYRALNRIVHMERFDDISKTGMTGSDYFALRTISILENCKNHPLHMALVKYIYSLDKYKLNVSDLGLRRFISFKREQEGKDVQFTKYNYGDDIGNIRSFRTYKILKELSV